MEAKSTVVKNPNSGKSGRASRIFLFSIALLPVICAGIRLDPMLLLLSVLSFIGACVCGLGVLRSVNKNDPMAAKWCRVGERFDCDLVLESIRFSKYIYLADIGLVYFSGLYLFLLVGTITNLYPIVREILVLPFALAFLVSTVSLWYQGRVVRKWCRLCLSVSAVIWAQAAVLAGSFETGKPDIHLREWPAAVVLLVICLLASSGWLRLKPFIIKANEVDAVRKLLKTWKRDPAVFIALQKKQPRSDVSMFPGEFILGAADAPVQIMTAMSLTCRACQFEYKKLDRLLDRFSHKVAIVVRFRYDPRRKNSMEALQFILNKYAESGSLEERRRILKVWFEHRNLEKCKRELGDAVSGKDYSDLFDQYHRWFKANKITRTPTEFINGYRLADTYQILDLLPLMRHLPGRLSFPQTINT